MGIIDFTGKVRALLDAATKEPWEAGDESDSHYDVCIGETICSLNRANPYTGKYVISRDEMIANAHLIISAPTLLREACERIEKLEKVAEAARVMRFVRETEKNDLSLCCDASLVQDLRDAISALDAADEEEK